MSTPAKPHAPQARRAVQSDLRALEGAPTCATQNSSARVSRSNSPAVPSRPSTPRGRRTTGGSSRYPSHLGAGASSSHVPLHRRGTSHTYERLEDLLKEAGYKDTRVFTPEAERMRAKAQADRDLEATPTPQQKGPVDTVMGFISGLVHSRPHTPSPTFASSPPSPTTGKAGRRLPAAASPSSTQTSLYPSASSHTRRSQTESAVHSTPMLRPRPSQAGLTYSEAAQAHRHLQHAALRHMASVPDLTPRTRRVAASNTSSALRRVASSRPGNAIPSISITSPMMGVVGPVPTGWLDAVARAVLGVPAKPPRRRPSRSPARRPTDRSRGRAPAPGNYLSRAPTATGPVSTTRVICHSAPGSRATSLVRRKSKAGPPPRVPVLARTAVEHDPVWHPPVSPARSGSSSSFGVSVDCDDSADSDEEDGRELDLARMLVPPKRKQSIRSLRRHLTGPVPSLPRMPGRPRAIGLGLDLGPGGGIPRMTSMNVQADPHIDAGLVRRGTTDSRRTTPRPDVPISWNHTR